MKRVVIILLLLLLSFVLSVTAAAEGETAYLQYNSFGEQTTFTLYLSNVTSVRAIAVTPEFDSQQVTLLKGQWMIEGVLNDFSLSDGNGVIGFSDSQNIEGAIFRFVTSEVSDSRMVRCRVVLSMEGGNIITLYAESTLDNPICQHNFIEKIVHEKYKVSDANCTEPAVYYYSCSCGEVGVQTFANGNALNHQWSEEYRHTETGHSKICVQHGCSASTEEQAHSWGNGTILNGTKRYSCQVCGRERIEELSVLPQTQPTTEPVQRATTAHSSLEPPEKSYGVIWIIIAVASCIVILAIRRIRKEKGDS